MSEPPPEPNTEFDFREPPMTQEAGEEIDEGGMAAGDESAGESGENMDMTAGNATPDPEEDKGCDQSSAANGDRTAHLIGILLFALLAIRRRRLVK